MANRPGGRQKHIVGGGGNANRRGGGLGGGGVGGYSRPSGGGTGNMGGNRAGGSSNGCGGLVAILIALLLGRSGNNSNAGANGGSDTGTSRSGCLKRIILLAVILFVAYFLIQTCSGSGSGLLSGLLDGGTGTSLSELYGGAETDTPGLASPTATPILAESSVSSYGITPASGSEDVYAKHEPNYLVSSAAREKYASVANADTVTVMVYMCGADLESQSGMATYDLQEMASAQLSDNVRIIVETGGASRWQNTVVKANTNMYVRVKQGGLQKLKSDLGKRSMTDPDTLSDFIQYCKSEYPADRYMLIMWDHGGGSITGYGYDENFPNGSMDLGQFNKALKAGGVKFDLIGFDACLMATLETALVSEPYADYLVASEATEPGTGWYYTNWLSDLSENTAISTVDLGKVIVDDFVKYSEQGSSSSKATLSLIDLAEVAGTVPSAFNAFSTSTAALIESDGYQQVASARSGSRDFSTSTKINQIDLIHFAENLGTSESTALANALRGCVKYNRNSKNITHASGVSIYFPYNSLSKVSAAIKTYDAIGLDQSYTKCISSFASVSSGGQVASGASGSAFGTLLGDNTGSLLGSLLGGAYSAEETAGGSVDTVASLLQLFLSDRSLVTGDKDSSWVDADLVERSAAYYAENNAGFANLTLAEKNGALVLQLSESQWEQVVTLEQNVFLDDGEGFIDLGLDNIMEYDDDGDLLMTYDGTWMSLNGQIVAYYLIGEDWIDEAYTIVGRVPALLNGTRVNLILEFTNDHPYGELLGAQTDYEAATTEAVMKGLLPINAGDKLDFICDFYNYDGTFEDSYFLGEQMIAGSSWSIGNAYVGNDNWQMCYRLTDIYGGKYWTPAVVGK